MTWIYGIPAWLFMLASVLVASTVAVAALVVARDYPWRNRSIAHNDVAGPILTTVGTVLAVMMSFMVVGVWQEYDAAAQTAQTEASALSDLHHLADAFPDVWRRRVQSTLDDYAKVVVTQEWPLMRSGATSTKAHDEIYGLERTLLNYDPKSAHLQDIQSRALDRLTALLDARRDRVMANRQGIPIILWVAMFVLGVVTVVISFYFRVDLPVAHIMMVGALAGVIAITFALIAELDYPFRGDMAVGPDAFTTVESFIHLDRADL